MNTLTLVDPQSGQMVHVAHAELPQRCVYCGAEMQGSFIATMEGGPGWVCLPHLERMLLAATPSAGFTARARVKQQMIHNEPGDVITVTQTLLTALEAW